jgi:hypothetical protein
MYAKNCGCTVTVAGALSCEPPELLTRTQKVVVAVSAGVV